MNNLSEQSLTACTNPYCAEVQVCTVCGKDDLANTRASTSRPATTDEVERASIRVAGALWPDADWDKHLRPEDREHCRKLARAALNQGDSSDAS